MEGRYRNRLNDFIRLKRQLIIHIKQLIKMSLEKLVSEYDTFQKRTGEMVKDLRVNFPPLFTRLFEKHPWVESFSWRQCEPWRDGDETEFEVMHDPERIYLNDETMWDNGSYENMEKRAVYEEISEVLAGVPIDIMKALFGESNEVEIKKSGEIFVTEYEDG